MIANDITRNNMKRVILYDALLMQLLSFMGGRKTDDSASRPCITVFDATICGRRKHCRRLFAKLYLSSTKPGIWNNDQNQTNSFLNTTYGCHSKLLIINV